MEDECIILLNPGNPQRFFLPTRVWGFLHLLHILRRHCEANECGLLDKKTMDYTGELLRCKLNHNFNSVVPTKTKPSFFFLLSNRGQPCWKWSDLTRLLTRENTTILKEKICLPWPAHLMRVHECIETKEQQSPAPSFFFCFSRQCKMPLSDEECNLSGLCTSVLLFYKALRATT